MAIKVKRIKSGVFTHSPDDDTPENRTKTLVDRQLGFESASGNLKINDNGVIKNVVNAISIVDVELQTYFETEDIYFELDGQKTRNKIFINVPSNQDWCDYDGNYILQDGRGWHPITLRVYSIDEKEDCHVEYLEWIDSDDTSNLNSVGTWVRYMSFGNLSPWRKLGGSNSRLGVETVGSTIKPIFLNEGIPEALSSTIGAAAKPVYISSGAITACSSTVGAVNQPVYMNAGTITALSSKLVFDRVITTQTEFNELLAASGTNSWNVSSNKITSVAFVGAFTLAADEGLKVPSTVKRIQGFNGAKVTITNALNGEGLWYEIKPTSNDYSISDLAIGGFVSFTFKNCINLINCTSLMSWGSGFNTCDNLVNCTSVVTSVDGGRGFVSCNNLTNCTCTITNTTSNTGRGFVSCNNLTNCISTIESDSTKCGFQGCTYLTNCSSINSGRGNCDSFSDCRYLTNCSGTNTGSGSGYSSSVFLSCVQMTNCVGRISSYTGNSYAFNECSYISSCWGEASSALSTSNAYGFYSCHCVSSCTGQAYGSGSGYGFYDCSYTSCCIGSGTSGIWGGNSKIGFDDDSNQQ